MAASKTKYAEARVGMPVGEYIRQAVAQGLRPWEMAEALGVSRPTVWIWMRAHGYRAGYRRSR
jgi:transcriptional regulator of acetoin/glycerol metabolism